jgi:hypothetical protein
MQYGHSRHNAGEVDTRSVEAILRAADDAGYATHGRSSAPDQLIKTSWSRRMALQMKSITARMRGTP